ncbi:MAG: hypothetical protein ABIG56_05060 [Candidatus Omnitrophota bacterium]
MDKKMKKKWQKPQLIILVRGGQAERILSICKTSVRQAGGMGFWWGGCEWTEWSCDNQCDSMAGS